MWKLIRARAVGKTITEYGPLPEIHIPTIDYITLAIVIMLFIAAFTRSNPPPGCRADYSNHNSRSLGSLRPPDLGRSHWYGVVHDEAGAIAWSELADVNVSDPRHVECRGFDILALLSSGAIIREADHARSKPRVRRPEPVPAVHLSANAVSQPLSKLRFAYGLNRRGKPVVVLSSLKRRGFPRLPNPACVIHAFFENIAAKFRVCCVHAYGVIPRNIGQ